MSLRAEEGDKLKTVRLPILMDERGIPKRVTSASLEELMTWFTFLRKIKERYENSGFNLSGKGFYVSLPIPDSFEEFKAILFPRANLLRTIIVLWTPKISCYFDLCANLLIACGNDLVIQGEEREVDELVRIWNSIKAARYLD